MRGCSQILAICLAILFMVTAVFALFFVNLTHGLTDRDAVKSVLNLEPMVREAVPIMLTDILRSNAAERGLAVDQIDDAILDEAFDLVVPPGYINDLTETTIDSLYDYLETGDPNQATINLDVRPLVDRLQGEPGQQAIQALVQSLPPCDEPLSPEQLQAGQIEINNCVPPNIPTETAVILLHQTIVEALNENPQIIGEAIVRINPFEANLLSPAQLEQIAQFQRTFSLLQRWSWLLWLIPLLCLALILTLVVRSVSQWGFWWGWPLLLAGLFALVLAAMVPATLLIYSRTAVSATADGGLTAAAISQRLAQNLTDLWLRRVLIQSGIMTGFGLILVILGFATRTTNEYNRSAP